MNKKILGELEKSVRNVKIVKKFSLWKFEVEMHWQKYLSFFLVCLDFFKPSLENKLFLEWAFHDFLYFLNKFRTYETMTYIPSIFA